MKLSLEAVDRDQAAGISAPLNRTAAPPLVPADPIIDMDHLARMTLGDAHLADEVLQLFACQAKILLGRMANAEPRTVAAFAHTLTGSARGIGAWKVAAAAEALERAAVARAPVVFEGALGRLVDAVGDAQMAIAAWSR